MKTNFVFLFLIFLSSVFFGAFVSGCASSDIMDRVPTGNYENGDNGSRAHPAAYLTEIFPVHKPYKKRPPRDDVKFFFKECSPGGERWPYSRTSYDCN